ncbi:hypothetical protein [Intrasporangium calvum]|uniref:Uncharacterized protein n=1 Tax=Intrasporangium calvum (strain ATCC 23552 / DSM 43043 / JCM 3097 / NBRC 12989 / NCIMB 10167 / NRRL B-3866 / 7 KIP) TaxID=710696 RepID=E6SF86_INTC7|nr:hypothetical protein [Intrasporangium calvum]ADU49900.1 hypothetical protein Intca_3420 [Intrasporangium calvum DSM 43043]
MSTHRRLLVALGAAVTLIVAACSAGEPNGVVPGPVGTADTTATTTGTGGATSQPTTAPLRAGEKLTRVVMSAGYLPRAPHGGTDRGDPVLRHAPAQAYGLSREDI